MKKITRESLVKKLERLNVKVHGMSEDFNGDLGGIWVSLEYGKLSEYNTLSEKFYNSEINNVIKKSGYFLENYDGGTALIFKA